jgi:hypothetical protein
MQAQDRDPPIARAFAALPDIITSAAFWCAWIAPGTLGYPRVRDLMLLMLIEFIVMHSGGFTAAIFGMENISRTKRALFLAGLTAFYMVFVLGFSLAFDSIWPIWGFLWLFVSRFLLLFTSSAETPTKMRRMLVAWVVSALAYLSGAVFTAFVPLPSLGITPEVIENLHLSGSGLWIEQPWTVLAFGALYFALLAYAKIKPSVVTIVEAPAGKSGP